VPEVTFSSSSSRATVDMASFPIVVVNMETGDNT
jgi:hypothetical protein